MGKEAACFVVSGTAGNLCSMMAYCERRGSEVITGDKAHMILYEGGGISAIANALVRTVQTHPNGSLNLDEIEKKIRKGPKDPMFPSTECIAVETTHCSLGGKVVPLSFFEELRQLSNKYHSIPIHLDGARLFNACASLNCSPLDITRFVDSVTFCLSKGLGCPVGSVICGSSTFIKRVRRARKMVGGTTHQCGILAAAGLIGLQEKIYKTQIHNDNKNAHQLSEMINETQKLNEYLVVEEMPESNLIYVTCKNLKSGLLVEEMGKRGVLCFCLGDTLIRMVLHLEIVEKDLILIRDILVDCVQSVQNGKTKKQGGTKENSSNEEEEAEYGSWNTN